MKEITTRGDICLKDEYNFTYKVADIASFGDRSAVICRKMLETICYGDTVVSPSVRIDDSNRKEYFDLLMAMYGTERKYLDSRLSEGVSASAKK